MSLVKKQFISSKEEYQKAGKTHNAYFRIGELLTLKDDNTGKEYHRIKLYLVPDRTFVLFDDKQKG